jgi:tetratricopeptide (TPR) repeat protein
MELVNGRSLRSLLELGEPLPLPDVLRHAEGLAGALAAAHARGILHRDVNPKNIMVTTDGRALLTDFGLARVTRDRNPDSDSTETQENDVTRAGAVLGTPGYMSPEQALGRTVDPRSDLFCLGAVLYEMCTRQRAFSASDTGNVLDAVLHHDPPPITRVRTDAPPELERIVRKLLSKEAQERYQDAADVVADVRALRRQVEWERYGSGRSQPAVAAPRPRRRRLLAMVAATLVALTAWGLLRPREAGPKAFADRDWLLISSFENDTGEALFDKTLREGLVAVLNQSSYVNILPDERIAEGLRRMRRDPGTPLAVPVARELAEREGVRAVLTGSIRKSGRTHRIIAQVMSPRTGSVVAAESESFDDPDELFSRVDALARRLRERLGESLQAIEGASVPLEEATTSSLEALRLYSAARFASRTGDLASATALLQQSVGVDPDFALAHARLADARAVDGDRAKAIESYARAAALAGDVSVRERYLITARLRTARRDYEGAAESLRALVGLYPDDLAAHQELALAYENIGQRGAAITELRECVRLDPNGAHAHGNLMLLLATESREDEAIQAYDQARARQLDSPYFGWGVGLARLGRGEVAEARATFERMQASSPPYDSWGRFYRARMDAFEGRTAQALGRLEQDCVLYQDRRNKTFEILSRNLRAQLLWQRGQPEDARRELDRVLRESDEALWPAELRNAGVLLARMNALADARNVRARLERLDGASTAVGRSCLRTIEGEIALAEKRAGDARRAFVLASEAYPHPAALQGVARVEEHERRWPDAAQAWQKVIEARGAVLRFSAPPDWALAHLQRGRALKLAGEVDAARREYGIFATLWREAEPSPLAEQARRELETIDKPAKRP